MRHLIISCFVVLLFLAGCSKQEAEQAPTDSAVDVGHDEGEEEGGDMVAKDFSFMSLRRGAHLMLAYDADLDAFTGTVKNETEETLCGVRVEVHTDTGTELGPTPLVDLIAGEIVNVTLEVDGLAFDQYTAHPEVSPCSGEGGEREGEEGEHGDEESEHEGEESEHGDENEEH